jgi:hypothetical protein
LIRNILLLDEKILMRKKYKTSKKQLFAAILKKAPEDGVLRDSPTGCKERSSPEVNFKGIRGKELFRSFLGFL